MHAMVQQISADEARRCSEGRRAGAVPSGEEEARRRDKGDSRRARAEGRPSEDRTGDLCFGDGPCCVVHDAPSRPRPAARACQTSRAPRDLKFSPCRSSCPASVPTRARQQVVAYMVEDHELRSSRDGADERRQLPRADRQGGLRLVAARSGRRHGNLYGEQFDEELDSSLHRSQVLRPTRARLGRLPGEDADRALALFFEMLKARAFSRIASIRQAQQLQAIERRNDSTQHRGRDGRG